MAGDPQPAISAQPPARLGWVFAPGFRGNGRASERFLVRFGLTFPPGTARSQSCAREPSGAQAAIGCGGEDLAKFDRLRGGFTTKVWDQKRTTSMNGFIVHLFY